MRTLGHKRAGFSLVELMVVVGLIGLLTLFAIPAFQSAGRGGKLRSAVFQLNTSFSLARQTAITTRQDVYLLFPDDHENLYDGIDPAHVEKAFRSYAIYAQRDGYITEWRMLPQGIVLDPDIEPYIVGSFPNLFLTGNTLLLNDIRFPANDGPPKTLFGLGFRSDGPIHIGGAALHPAVFLSEGWTDYNIETGSFSAIHVMEDLLVMGIRVNAITGQTTIEEFERP